MNAETREAYERQLRGIRRQIESLRPAWALCRNDTDEHETLADRASREAALAYLSETIYRLEASARDIDALLLADWRTTAGPDPVAALLADMPWCNNS